MGRIIGGVLAVLFVPTCGLAGEIEYTVDLAGWVVTQPPKVGDGRWFTANNDAEHEWVVFLRGDRPSVRRWSYKREKGSTYPEQRESYPPMPFVIPQGSAKEGLAGEWFSVQVSDGWVIGFNAGEFGACLWWFSPDGKTRYKISDDQVIGFFESGAGLLALEGIAHGSTARGRIVQLSRGEGGLWHSEPFVDLKGAPETACLNVDGTLTVATYDRLLRVHVDTRKLDVLLSSAFWGGLYPTSLIVAPSGTVYLGMRHGVARVEKAGTGYEARWLVPNLEFDRPAEPGFR